MVTDRKEAAGEEFEAARADLEASLRDRRVQERFAEWYEEARAAADVDVIDVQIKAFQHRLDSEYEEAAHYYKLAIEETPDDGYLYASLGDVYLAMENLDEAIAYYEQAVERVPGDAGLFMLASSTMKQRLDEAAGFLGLPNWCQMMSIPSWCCTAILQAWSGRRRQRRSPSASPSIKSAKRNCSGS